LKEERRKNERGMGETVMRKKKEKGGRGREGSRME